MNPRDAVLYAVLYTKVMITHCDNLVTVVQSFGAVSEVYVQLFLEISEVFSMYCRISRV